MEEMEKRSRRRTRDLVTQAASQGLSQNEIGCARISMMARSTNAPCKGRIQMRKTNPLHFFTFGLQRTAGPYSRVILDRIGLFSSCPVLGNLGNAGCPVLPVEGIGLDVIQAPKPEPRIMRYELTDFEWAAIRSFLPNKPRGIPRVDDRRVLSGIFWVLRSGAPWRDLPETYGPRTT